MTSNQGAEAIITSAEADTSVHLRYLNNAILHQLQFTIIIILIDIINVVTTQLEGVSAQLIKDILTISPNPVLLIALIASAGIQFYLLLRIRACHERIGRMRRGQGPTDGERRSVTDVNYDIVRAMNTSLKVWPFVAVLFVLYFIGCLSMLVELILGIDTGIALNSSTALNLTTVIISAYFFIIQTNNWRVQRRKMRRLENMEKMVSDELHI